MTAFVTPRASSVRGVTGRRLTCRRFWHGHKPEAPLRARDRCQLSALVTLTRAHGVAAAFDADGDPVPAGVFDTA